MPRRDSHRSRCCICCRRRTDRDRLVAICTTRPLREWHRRSTRAPSGPSPYSTATRSVTATATGLCRTADNARQRHVKMDCRSAGSNRHVASLNRQEITPPCLPGNSETLQQTSLHALAHCKMYIPYHSSESLSHHDGLVLVPPPYAGVLRHLDLPKPQLSSAAFSPPQAVLVQAICPARQTTHSASIRDVEHRIDRARVIRLFPRL